LGECREHCDQRRKHKLFAYTAQNLLFGRDVTTPIRIQVM
jgi:hypothetical protein